MSNVDINVDRRSDGQTDGRADGRTDGQKIGCLYHTLLQAGAIINNYDTDVCFQFHPINSMSNNVSHNKTNNYPIH